MKEGDKVLIAPDLTHKDGWTEGTIIEVEKNPFVGMVISAETEDGDVFFGRDYMFRSPEGENSCSQSI